MRDGSYGQRVNRQGTPTRVEIALVEDQKLVELHQQKTKTNFSVGDIFLGKIKKTMPSLNAVFVDIGHRKDAFLHYTDMGPKLRTIMKFTEDSINGVQQTALLDNFEFEPEIIKTGKVDQVIKKNENSDPILKNLFPPKDQGEL